MDSQTFSTEDYRIRGEEWAHLDGEARMLEEMRKVVLNEVRQQSEKKTEAAKETAAYASQQYRRHIRSMVEARTKANVSKAMLDALKMAMDVWRTKESTKRAEMTLR